MMNILMSILAVIILLAGIVSMITPIPGGTLLIAGGFSLLICSSSKAQACVRYVRTKNSRFNKIIFWMEDKVGVRINFIGTALAKTRPQIES
jgi:uncharacterized protein YqgC (DUF456 family)